MSRSFDRLFFIAVLILLVVGFVIFISASMGLYARGSASFASVVSKQFIVGIMLGGTALYVFSRIHFRFWRRHALAVFALSLLATLAVFIPGLGFEHGGATRWLSIFGFSLQPSELLKLGFVIYLSAWLAHARDGVRTTTRGLIPLLVIVAFAGGTLVLQPDIGTLLVLCTTALLLFIIAGARIRDVALLVLVGVLAGIILISVKPYILDRMLTFINPARDAQGSGWQIQQSLIAVGSGQITGRGFGQGVQKFNFLPEPIGDSVFAVAAEEFGFIGSIGLLLLFLFFATRGFAIAARAPDTFSRLLVCGIVILIVVQSFLNIGSMLGVFPLTGMPLLFISQGGSALFVTLAATGIVLNVSRYMKRDI